MKYLSVFSGIEAASLACKDLGWKTVGFSEIDPFACSVLKHHYPDIPNYGDITKYKQWPIEPGTVDLLIGGSPCQSFSLAGLRKGLDDPRGNLALVFLGLADHIKPRWIVWENVVGVLSSKGGRDFGAFLGALGQLGYGWAYRILDAQYFGVAQRRRRVFVVACLGAGGWASAAEVLSIREGIKWDKQEDNERAVSPTLQTTCNDYSRADGFLIIESQEGLRRLTVTEAERLQGFPDNWTKIPTNNKNPEKCPDGPRYKCLGNTFAVPVVRWIGTRIAAQQLSK
jgi:DNA (cytosine-5)-methyltransferase 1